MNVSLRSDSSRTLPGGGTVKVHPEANGDAHVTIEGEFRLGWLGGLSRALSRRRVDIRSLDADLDERGNWRVELRLRGGPVDPSSLDFANLLADSESESSRRPMVRIDHATVERDPGGCLVLRVIAPDELGFLAQVLGRLGFLGAFPERIQAQGDAGRLTDSFWLKSFGRTPISEVSAHAIAQAFSAAGTARRPSTNPPLSR